MNFSRRAGEGDERWANRKLCGHACRGAFNSRGIIERLEHYRKINEDTGCWVWTGAEHGNGYASMTVAGRRAYVHRVSHEQYIGPIPDGFDVDHLCFNRLCFNPEHLQAVTRAENGNYPLTVEPDSENIRSHGKQDDAPDEENDDSTHFDPELYELEVEAAAELEESLSSGDSDD